jgi:hypothetical protein
VAVARAAAAAKDADAALGRGRSLVRSSVPLPLQGEAVPEQHSGPGDTSDIAAAAARYAAAERGAEASPPGARAAGPVRVEPVRHAAGVRGSKGAPKLGLASGSIAPTGAPERKLELVALLALFLLFFLDVARRVASGWAVAAAESGRRPERPG